MKNTGKEEQCCDLFRNVAQSPSGIDEPSLELTRLHGTLKLLVSESKVLILELTQKYPWGSTHTT